jgi:hypothetical protein
MKHFHLLLGVLASFAAHAQDAQTFHKAFKLPKVAITMEGTETSRVPKNKELKITRKPSKFKDPQLLDEKTVYYISKTEAIEVDKADVDHHIAIITEDTITLKAGCEYTTHYINPAMRRTVENEKPAVVKVQHVKASEGFLSFADDTVWVNPNLSGDFEDEGVYFYKLTNRQTLTFKFSEFTVSPLTLPIKYRFGGTVKHEDPQEEKSFSEEFSTAINLNVFGARAWGRTRYHYRNKTGSITTTEKLAAGGILGVSTVTLDASNTSAARSPLMGDAKLTKGLVTVGGGGTYSINKLSFGLFGGWDFSVGDDAALWNYNHRPWVGLAIGYALFPFAQ